MSADVCTGEYGYSSAELDYSGTSLIPTPLGQKHQRGILISEVLIRGCTDSGCVFLSLRQQGGYCSTNVGQVGVSSSPQQFMDHLSVPIPSSSKKR